MALSDTSIRKAKIPEGKKQAKFADGEGMYLLVTGSGKYWRLDYRLHGRRNTLSLGKYPDVSLKLARERRREAREQLAEGIDPQTRRLAKRKQDDETFATVAEAWLENESSKWSAHHQLTTRNRLENYLLPTLGSTPIRKIEPPDILLALRRIEARGNLDTAHRIKSICSRVFKYAIATGAALSDPCRDLSHALKPSRGQHFATIVEPKKVGELLRAIDGYQGTYQVKVALQVAPYLFVRPGELRHAEWDEFDLEAAEWRIPAHKMKMRSPHIVPLSTQVVARLRELQRLAGCSPYLFPSVRSSKRPMSDNTINGALRRLGFDKSEICGHGFRAMASTLLHEQGWSSDVIERQLAHTERNKVKAAYNHAEHLPQRRKMMQAWADYLDGLRSGAEVVPLFREQS